MDPNIFHTIRIGVDIQWLQATRTYEWMYHICMYDGPVTPSESGDVVLAKPGRTKIVYDLLYDAAGMTPDAKAADMAKRKQRFEAGIDKMVQIADAP